MTITARSLADRLNAVLVGNKAAMDTPIVGIAPLDKANSGEVSFLASEKYVKSLSASQAGVLLLSEAHVQNAPAQAALVLVPNPYSAYAQVSHLFSQEPTPDGSIHPSAVIDPEVQLGDNVSIGAHVVIGTGCHLGDNTVIESGSVLGARVRLGARSVLKANVTVHYDVEIGEECVIHSGAVIGGDGFGFAPSPDGWVKIAQLGRVLIGHRVEIGSNTTIDRGAIEDTLIEDGVIIDNLTMLAHNVRVGRGTAMAAQVGVAGSTHIGANCIIGGQAGFAGHLDIADGSHFTGQSMVTKGTTEGGGYASGWPIQPAREWRRTVARLRHLGKLEARLKELERRTESADTKQTQKLEDNE